MWSYRIEKKSQLENSYLFLQIIMQLENSDLFLLKIIGSWKYMICFHWKFTSQLENGDLFLLKSHNWKTVICSVNYFVYLLIGKNRY